MGVRILVPKEAYVRYLFVLLGSLAIFGSPQSGDEHRFDIGLHLKVGLGDGVPANDIVGYGLTSAFVVGEDWRIRFTVDQVDEFDFERPWKVVGLVQHPDDPVVDSLGSMTTLSMNASKIFKKGETLEWTLGGGLGVAVMAIDDATGFTTDDSFFVMHTETGKDMILSLVGAMRINFAANWAFDFTLSLDRHFADWQVLDRVSQATGTVDDFSVQTFKVGVAYRY